MWRILPWISLDVDKLGLDNNDRTLLLTLIQKFSGGPVGLERRWRRLSERIPGHWKTFMTV